MLIIPLNTICSQVPELVTLLSDSVGLKVGEFDADNYKNAPYVCWQIINSNPEQYLSDRSDMDDLLVQVDVFAKSKGDARTIAKLVRKAIDEDYCYIDNYTGVERDPETNLWCVRMDTRWHEEP